MILSIEILSEITWIRFNRLESVHALVSCNQYARTPWKIKWLQNGLEPLSQR